MLTAAAALPPDSAAGRPALDDCGSGGAVLDLAAADEGDTGASFVLPTSTTMTLGAGIAAAARPGIVDAAVSLRRDTSRRSSRSSTTLERARLVSLVVVRRGTPSRGQEGAEVDEGRAGWTGAAVDSKCETRADTRREGRRRGEAAAAGGAEEGVGGGMRER